MAIVAHLQETEASAGQEKPRHPRRVLSLETQGALESGTATKVLVHNISQTGLLLESPLPLGAEERIAIELPHAGACWARTVWASGDLYGCQFESPIPAAALSAAQLRSAVAAKVDVGEARQARPDASFGARLQRLRAARGLSQAQVAQTLGVSKPTVWAWEHGKARPVEERLDALAQVLGVERAELNPKRAASTMDDLIAQHREQIALAFGVGTEFVRISIEL